MTNFSQVILPPGVVIPPPPIPPPNFGKTPSEPMQLQPEINEEDRWVEEEFTETIGKDGRIYVDGIPLPTEPKPLPPLPAQPFVEENPVVEDNVQSEAIVSETNMIEPQVGSIAEGVVGPSLPSVYNQQRPAESEDEVIGPTFPKDMHSYSYYDQVTMNEEESVTAPYPMMSYEQGDEDEGVTAPYPNVTIEPSSPSQVEVQPTVVKAIKKPQPTAPTPSPMPDQAKKKITVSKNVAKMVPTSLRLARHNTTPSTAKRTRTGETLLMPTAAQVTPKTIPTNTQTKPVDINIISSNAPQPSSSTFPSAIRAAPQPKVVPTFKSAPKEKSKKNEEEEMANFMKEMSGLL